MAGDFHLQVILSVVDKATAQIQNFTKSLGLTSQQLKGIGIAAGAFGAAIVGSMALAVKSAAEEEAGVIKLSAALRNTGVSYGEVKGQLESVIEATQQKTSVSDSQQRDALSKLVGITGDYEKSLDLLGLSLDLATWYGMDYVTAAQVIGRVSEGNTSTLARYGIEVREGASALEALGAIAQKVGGQAEAFGTSFAGQINRLKNNFSDLSESIGAQLLPIVTTIVDKFNSLVVHFKNMSPQMRNLTIAIGLTTAALGFLTAGFIAYLFLAPQIAIALHAIGIAAHAALGPIGLITLAISGLATAGAYMALQYTTQQEQLRTEAKETADKMIAEANRIKEEEINRLGDMRTKSISAHDAEIQRIEKEYGIYEGSIQDKMTLAQKYYAKEKQNIDKEIGEVQKAHITKITLINKEYSLAIKLLNQKTEATIQGINDEIDAILDAQNAEDKARENAANQAQISTLEEQIANEEDVTRRGELERELYELKSELAIQARRDKRNTDIDALRDTITTTQKEAKTEAEKLEETRDKDIETEIDKHEALIKRLEEDRDALEPALEEELKRIDTEKNAAIQMEADRHGALLKRLADNEQATIDYYNRELQRAKEQAERMKAAAAGEAPTYWETVVTGMQYGGQFQHGGIVRKPTLALIGEKGPEAIIPLSGQKQPMGGLIVNFNAPVYGQADFERVITQIIRDASLRGAFYGVKVGA